MFVTLTCAFRYGREDLDVLGLSFRKDLFIATYQAFPPMPNPPRPPTRLQDRLLRKLGQHAHPFFFTVRMPPTLCKARGLGLCLGGEAPVTGRFGKNSKEGALDPPPFRVTLHSGSPCLSVSSLGPLLHVSSPELLQPFKLRLGGRFGGLRRN